MHQKDKSNYWGLQATRSAHYCGYTNNSVIINK